MQKAILLLLFRLLVPGNSLPLAGKSSAPKVYLYLPHNEMFISKRASEETALSLICTIEGFEPSDISVQWLMNDNALPEDNYVNTPVMKDQSNDSFFMYSTLRITNTVWNRGNRFTCMVVHEGLPTKVIQRSVEKSQGTK